MYFRVALFAAILALVGAGEAAAVAPRGGGETCSCNIQNSIAVCANCDQVCILNGVCV
jgi:hypothetical protein